MSHRSREGVSARAEANRQTWRDSEASVRSKMRQRIRGLRERMREERYKRQRTAHVHGQKTNLRSKRNDLRTLSLKKTSLRKK